MNEQPKIAILLATYNGSEFLSAQLDSLLAQSYQNFILVVRDDCSTDDTGKILQDYIARYPQMFHQLQSESANLGASASFSCLLDYVLENKQRLGLDMAYMMFCDQDDVWHEHKIERELQAMLETEAGNADLPVLVHSDLEVVSESLATIAPSFIRYQGLDSQRNQFCDIVISNLVTGCTALINEALAKKACPVAKQAIMHDWWLALVATAFGKMVYLDTPLVRYRQHGRNTIGAKEFVRVPVNKRSLLGVISWSKANSHLNDVARQARAFNARYWHALDLRMRLCLRIVSGMDTRIGIYQRSLYLTARRM